MKKRLLQIAGIMSVVLLLATAGFVIWASDAAQPTAEAEAALQTTQWVRVSTPNAWFVFEPLVETADTGLIFYPGGRVDARAYAPYAQAIAEAGYTVVIVPMPLNLAVFAPGRAADVIAATPHIQQWAIGGHSLGGSMAANFADDNPGTVAGIVLWASYPAAGDSLADTTIEAVSVYGTNDGLLDGAQIEASRALLPQNTTFVSVPGGNHAQFGWYGEQTGDNAATISREEQARITLEATLQLLNEIDK